MNILPYIKILVLALSINAVESLSADHPPLDKNNFKEYVKALEEGDEDAFRTKFYHENFSTMFGDKLINRNDFIDFEKSLHESVKFNFNV